MDLPFCKICGMNHRLGFCPLYQEPPKPEKRESRHEAANHQPPEVPQKESPVAVAQDQGRQGAQPEADRPVVPPLKPKFDKRAYQRDLMRKRRALGLAK
jgi:hypothetical protein